MNKNNRRRFNDTPETLLNLVINFYDLTYEEVVGKTRGYEDPYVKMVRKVAMTILHDVQGIPVYSIAKVFKVTSSHVVVACSVGRKCRDGYTDLLEFLFENGYVPPSDLSACKTIMQRDVIGPEYRRVDA